MILYRPNQNSCPPSLQHTTADYASLPACAVILYTQNQYSCPYLQHTTADYAPLPACAVILYTQNQYSCPPSLQHTTADYVPRSGIVQF